MTEIIYIDELKDAYDELIRTAWILDDRMEDDFGDQFRGAHEQAQEEYDRLLEAYAVQERIKDVRALGKAIQAYARRQREIAETYRRRSDDNLQRFFNDVGRLSEDDE